MKERRRKATINPYEATIQYVTVKHKTCEAPRKNILHGKREKRNRSKKQGEVLHNSSVVGKKQSHHAQWLFAVHWYQQVPGTHTSSRYKTLSKPR